MIAFEQRSPVPFCQLHGLVGLWDMLPFVTDEFYKIVIELRNIRSTLGRPRAESISDNLYYTIHFATCERVHNLLIDLKPHLEVLGARITIQAIDEHEIYLIRGAVFAEDGLIAALDDIDTQLARELKSVTALVLSSSEHRLYAPQGHHFGREVFDKFRTTAVDEFSNAGKCLALGQPTACVFHLMRTVEVALEAIRLCLGVQILKPQDKTWGGVLNLYEKELSSRKNPQHPRQWKSNDADFFRVLHGTLVAVKDTIRDKTMHVENTYNQEQAQLVFDNVKEFMKKVASRMDEDGLPLA
jgi:hypothetical protein